MASNGGSSADEVLLEQLPALMGRLAVALARQCTASACSACSSVHSLAKLGVVGMNVATYRYYGSS